MLMESYLIWLVAGFVLVIAELATTTFYLLVLGIAAFAGAGAAWSGAPFWAQTLVAAGVALAGVWWVRQHRDVGNTASMPALDLGQAVYFESWVDQQNASARVKYRGAQWDAQLPAGETPAAGDVYYISAVDGSSLRVAKARP
jgi:membrane protein implicated in regulation of membrane protease activity